jgi:hypothetical protein
MFLQSVDTEKFDSSTCSYDSFSLLKEFESMLIIVQVTSKREALEEKSTGARNDYLLSLAAANAHQTRYFVVDLQSTMQVGWHLAHCNAIFVRMM